MYKNYDSLSTGRDTWLKKEIVDGSPPTSFGKKSKSLWLSTMFMVLSILLSIDGFSQIGSYSFATSSSPYSTIVGGPGTVAVTLSSMDDAISASQTIPFTFNFGGTNFTTFRINSNGWLNIGAASASTTNYTSLSGAENNVIAAFNRDLNGNNTTSTTYYVQTSGVSPNQITKIEWVNIRSFSAGVNPATGNFQIWLYETSNVVEMHYGAFTTSSGRTTTGTVQVGLRGASSATGNVRSLSNTGSWSTPTVGNANASTVAVGNFAAPILPDDGRVYTFTPPPPCSGAPTPGSIPATAGICIGGGSGTTLTATGYTTGVSGITFQWEESDDNGVGDAWANAVGGSGATTDTYTTPVLAAPMYYRLKVTCTGIDAFTNSSFVTLVNCTFDTALSSGITFTSIMPANGGTGTAFPGWINTSGDDNTSTTVSLAGTTFRYQGVPVAGFQASSNGWMTFNTGNTSTAFTNSLTGTGQNRVLAPFWDDLVFTGQAFANRDASLRYQVSGVLGSGSAVITVEWAGIERFNIAGPNMNFQVKLYESDNHIEYIYGRFEGFDGTFDSVYSYSIGYNGTSPGTNNAISRFAMQTANVNHFSSTTDPATLAIMPVCNTMITLTPGAYTGLGSAPAVPVPANNDSAGATVLTVLASPATAYCGTYYTSRGATDSGAGQACATSAGFQDDDVWFRFDTTAATDYNIRLRSSPGYNGVLQLLDASLTPITCVNATGSGLVETINAVGLTSGGTTYYLRVFHNAAGSGTTGEFSLSVSEVILPPANDNIAGSTGVGFVLPVNSTCVPTASGLPNTLAATASPEATCTGTADDDVWYSFVSTSDLLTVTVQSGGGYNAVMQIFSSSDNTPTGTLTSLTCANATGTAGAESFSGAFVNGNTYFVRVYHFATGAATGNFSICVSAPTPACTTNITPANLATNVTLLPTYTWAAAPLATSYDVYLGTASGTETFLANSVTTSFPSVTPLVANTQYFWYVVPKNGNGDAVCGVANETSFTTVACSEPINLAVSAVTQTSATLSWDASPSLPADGYQYEVRTSGTPGSGAVGLTDSGATAAGVLTDNVTLVADTNYFFYARSVCDAGTSLFSPWTTAVTFRTGYCLPAPLSVDDSGITNVTFGTINNTTGDEPGHYGNYSAQITDVVESTTVPVSITFETGFTYDTKIWVDWNDDFDFDDAGEEVYSGTSLATNPTTLAASFNVPAAAYGNHRLRIGGVDTGPPTVCWTGSFGTFEDYTINVTVPPTCSAPTALVASAVTTTSATINWTASVSLPADGYDYYYSDSNVTPTNATTPSGSVAAGILTANLSSLDPSTTYFFWVRSVCALVTDVSSWSASGTFFTGHCIPAPTSVDDLGITNVTFSSINNTTVDEPGQYGDYSAQIATVTQGTTVPVSITYETGFTYDTRIFVDWNDDLDFNDAGEIVYTGVSTAASPTTLSASFNVSISAPLGNHRLRIGGQDTGPVNACYTGSFGTFEDYTINVIAASPCVAPPTPGTIPLTFGTCKGGSTTITATGYSSGTGVTFQWEESDDNGVGDAWANVVGGSGDTTDAFTTPALNTNIYYRLAVTCSAQTDFTNSIAVTAYDCEYTVTKNAISYNSIITTGSTYTTLASADDGKTNNVSLAGTSFVYNGQVVTGFYATSNGWMTFNTAQTSSSLTNDLTSATQNNVLAPFWDDLVIQGNNLANKNSSMRYQVDGVLGSGTAVITVEWAEMERFSYGDPNMNFQVVLREVDNSIEFNYGNMQLFNGATNGTTMTYSVGINGSSPATNTFSNRTILQTANSAFFGTTAQGNLRLSPDCNSQLRFVPSATFSGGADPGSVPSNDESGTAITLPVNSSACISLCGNVYNSKNATASLAIPVCGAVTPGTPDDDVWFEFTADATIANHRIAVQASPGYDVVYQVLDSGLNAVACFNANATGISEINTVALTVGASYFLRVYDAATGAAGGAGGSGEFSVCISTVNAPPAYDEPAGAITLTVGTSCVTTPSVPSQIAEATATPGVQVCTGTPDDDVWYKFTTSADATGISYNVRVQGSGTYNPVLQVFNGLPGLANSISCLNATGNGGLESFTSTALLPNTDYYVRVYHSGSGFANGNFTVCVSALVPACIVAPIAPVNASTTCLGVATTTLSWAAAPSAITYDVYFDTGAGPAITLVSADQTGLTYNAGVLAAGTYAWKVTPKNSFGEPSGCNSFTFTYSPLSVSGSVSSDQTICSGSQPSDITLTGSTGAIQWQSATTNVPASFANIPGQTSATLTGASIGNLTATRYFRAIVTSGACASATSAVVTVNANPAIWTGSQWLNGITPDASTAVIFEGNYASVSDITACSLIVRNNAVVVVNSNHDFNITGNVDVQTGSLTFANNANLLQDPAATVNGNTGNVVVTRNASMRRQDYVYWSSPVANQNLLAFSPLTLTNRFYQINEVTNTFVPVNPATNSFVAPNGYAIRAPNTFPPNGDLAAFAGQFTGVANNGDYSVAITNSGAGKGYNLVGNPYPSPIDADLFLAENPGTLYFWTHFSQAATSGNNYATYNGVGAAAAAGGETPNGFIQTGQGFLLNTAANGTADFNNGMRVGNNQGQFYRTANVERHRIWMNLSSDATPLLNQALIGYMTGATQDVDQSLDGPLNYSGSSISSVINDGNYVIQGRSLPFADTDEVPMNFKAETDGSYTLAIDHVDGLFAEGQDIFLRDNLTGIVHNIKESAYTFASVAGTFANRFVVVYQSSPLGIETPGLDANSVIVFKKETSLHINSGAATMATVRIFDIRGRMIYEQDGINASTMVVNNLRAEQQVLIVQITSDDNKTVSKKVVY